MRAKPHKKEIKTIYDVFALPNENRANFFAHKVVMEGSLTFLTDEGADLYTNVGVDLHTFPSADGREFVPLWPSLKEAVFGLPEKCHIQLTQMELNRFLDEYTDELVQNGVYIGVFPNDSLSCCAMHPLTFRRFIQSWEEDSKRSAKQARID
jgi:hypothetical protein